MKNKKSFKLSVLLSLLILTVMLVLPCTDSHAAELILGDMDDNGEVNSNDAIYLLRHTLAPLNYPLSQSGNVNGEGGVTSDDAIYLLRHTLAPSQYPLLSCKHDLISHEAKAASCMDIGWEAYTKCRKCNFTTYKEISSLGHDVTSHPAQAPSCQSVGWDAYEDCSRCDYTTYSQRDKLTHNYVDGACSVCSTPYLSPNGFHAHVNKILEPIASTCTEAGLSDGVVCTACGKNTVKQTPMPLLPHDYENGKCNVCGQEPTASEGLSFAENIGGYEVVGIGECTDTQIVIPATHGGKAVTAIAPNAFSDNRHIVQIVVPSSVKKIGEHAFDRCVSLADIVLCEGLEEIGEGAFMYCTSLKSATLPDSVTKLSPAAFIACYDLREVTLGNGIQKIPTDLFFECFKMETVTVTAPVSSVGAWAFFDCDSLKTVNYGGSAEEWNSIAYGKYWDENSGNYTVYCADNSTVHKHSFGDWYETDTKCLFAHKCVECNTEQTAYSHGDSVWEFSADSIKSICSICLKTVTDYAKSDTVIKLDFDEKVEKQLEDYPYFTLVSDGRNAYQSLNGRSVWDVNSSTFIDYDKRAFESLDYYSISFDVMIADKGTSLRDSSIFSFVPGYNNGNKVGSSVSWIWQVKYLPLLDRLSTKALNGTDVPYQSKEDIPDITAYNDSNGKAFSEDTWATVDVVCDVNASRSYIFVDGTPIGSVSTFDYNNPDYANAFSLRFCDNTEFDTKIDNFKIVAMTLK